MRLNDNEKDYIKKMANVLKDADIAHELTRIRLGFGISEKVGKRQVTAARQRMGIRKAQGRGVNRIKKDKKDE
jgi:hypothetical protein|tara:strand:+ start:759 stop:977 length:219 start_codon:yes stop_codon:yes gene_type:complete